MNDRPTAPAGALANFPPAAFALVMATGIVAIASGLLGFPRVASGLFAINLLFWVTATWWIPLLFLTGGWRLFVQRVSPALRGRLLVHGFSFRDVCRLHLGLRGVGATDVSKSTGARLPVRCVDGVGAHGPRHDQGSPALDEKMAGFAPTFSGRCRLNS